MTSESELARLTNYTSIDHSSGDNQLFEPYSCLVGGLFCFCIAQIRDILDMLDIGS